MKRLLLFLLAAGSSYGANVGFDQTTKNTTPTNLNVKANTLAVGRTNSLYPLSVHNTNITTPALDITYAVGAGSPGPQAIQVRNGAGDTNFWVTTAGNGYYASGLAIGTNVISSPGGLTIFGPINSPSSSFNAAKNQIVIGGQQNTISATLNESVIVGGFQQSITAGNYSAIVGGDRNVIATNAVTAFIGGGQQCRVTYNSGSIAGLQNACDGDDSFMAAGNQCLITANCGWAAIIANDTSTITGPGGGDYYCILPGLNNNIVYALNSDDFCYILGGRGNRVTKANSWVMGMFLTNSAANQIEIGYNDFDKVRIDTNRLHLIGNMQIRMTNGANNGYVLTSTNGGDLVLMPSSGSSSVQATPGVVNVASAATIIIDLALTNTPVVVLTNAPAHDISLIISNPAPARWFSFYADGNALITNNATTWSGVSGLLLKWLDAATNSLIVSNGFISVSGYVAQTASKTNLVIAYRHE